MHNCSQLFIFLLVRSFIFFLMKTLHKLWTWEILGSLEKENSAVVLPGGRLWAAFYFLQGLPFFF